MRLLTALLCLMLMSAIRTVSHNNKLPDVITTDNVFSITEFAEYGNGPVSSLSWSPDGRSFAVASPSGIEVYDASNIENEPIFFPIDAPQSVAFHPNNNQLVASGCDSDTYLGATSYRCQAVVYVWDLSTFGRTELFRTDRIIRKIQIDARGSQLAFWDGSASMLRIFDIASNHSLLSIETEMPSDFAFNHDGNQIVTSRGSYGGGVEGFLGIQVWDTQTGELLASKEGVNVFYVGYSPDGQGILYGSGGSTQLFQWLFDTGETIPIIQDVNASPDYLNPYDVSHSGRYLLGVVSIFQNPEIFIWDLELAERVLYIQEMTSIRSDVIALSPDESMLLLGSSLDGVVELLNIETNERQVIHRTGDFWDVEFVSNHTIIFGGTGDSVWRWNFADESLPDRITVDGLGAVSHIEHTNDNQIWIVSSGVELFDWEAQTASLPFGDFTTRAIAINEDRNLLAFGDWIEWNPDIGYIDDEQCNPCGVLRIYDIGESQQRNFEGFHGISESIYHIAFDIDERYVVSGSNSEARIWDLNSQELVSKFDDQSIFNVFYAGFTPDNQFALGAEHFDGSQVFYQWQPEIWQNQGLLNYETAQKVFELDEATGRVTDVVFHPFEELRFVASPNKILVFSTTMGEAQEILTLDGHVGIVSSLALSPDQRFLVSTGLDGTVRIWGIESD